MNALRLGVAVISLLIAPMLSQAATVGPIPVQAVVNAVESMDCAIVKFTADGNGNEQDLGPSPNFDFGTLVRDTNDDGTPAALRGGVFFKVFCGVNTSGRAYTVTQNGTALTGGGTRIPDGAWIANPGTGVEIDGDDDYNDLPQDAAMGQRGTAVGNRLMYNSGPGGRAVVLQMIYAVTSNAADGATQPIPPDQTAATYSGNVTWTTTVQ